MEKLITLLTRIQWSGARIVRRFASILRSRSFVVIAVVAVCCIAGLVSLKLNHALEAEKTLSAARTKNRLVLDRPAISAEKVSNVEQGVAEFIGQLPADDEWMQTLADLFVLAEKYRLVLAKGEYQALLDASGLFLQHKMAIPIKGDPEAIQRFVEAALLQHPSLAFESIQFKREKIESRTLEARVQWSLFTRIKNNSMPAGRIDALKSTE